MNHGNDQRFSSPPPIGGGTDEAARAIADWPLLAMLAAGRPGKATPRAEAVIPTAEVAPVFIPPAPPPAASPPPAMAETVSASEPERAVAPLAEHVSESALETAPAAAREPEPSVRPPSALEQLFSRADKAGQAQPAKRAMFKQSGPPPLKTPGQSAADRAAGQSGAITIEPRPREWRELETAPDRLFDRVGDR